MITEAEFRRAILPFTLHYEGGLSTDPKDPGNWTGGKVGKGHLVAPNMASPPARIPRSISCT